MSESKKKINRYSNPEERETFSTTLNSELLKKAKIISYIRDDNGVNDVIEDALEDIVEDYEEKIKKFEDII